jgi:hypothetical protein
MPRMGAMESIRTAATAAAMSQECRAMLTTRRAGFSLPGAMYHEAAVFELDLTHVWRREWVGNGSRVWTPVATTHPSASTTPHSATRRTVT